LIKTHTKIKVIADESVDKEYGTGALGVVVPLVETREAAENAVRYTRYPPEGVRGCAPGR